MTPAETRGAQQCLSCCSQREYGRGGKGGNARRLVSPGGSRDTGTPRGVGPNANECRDDTSVSVPRRDRGHRRNITEGTGQQRNLCSIHVSRLIKLLRNSANTNRASRDLGRLPRFVFRSGLGTPQNFVLTFPPQPAFYLQFTLTRTLRRRENQSSRFAPSWNARGGTRASPSPRTPSTQ